MGGCASKEKKDKAAEDAGANGGGIIGAEGCVSNSMVFLAR